MPESVLRVPPQFRRGGKKGNEEESLASAVALIELSCKRLGLQSLAGKSVLDMGCGSKLVQALLNLDLPIERYVGVDIAADLIDFLQENVADERFSFHFMNTRNDMYNPEGVPLGDAASLPLAAESFDVICLFSVFTHLAPDDYVAMLKLLRRYIKPGGRIIYSLFVNETTAGGHGWIDGVKRSMREKAGTEFTAPDSTSATEPPDFVDANPQKPLFRAMYSRTHALELVEGTGWEVESLNDPESCIQHYMICRPG